MTRSGYYAWRSRAESARRREDRNLLVEIRRIFESSRRTYGSPRVQQALAVRGVQVSRRRVERLMRAGGMRGRVSRIYKSNPGLHRFYGQHPNRLWTKPARSRNRIWVGDVTYLRVGHRWRFLAVVIDQYSRRILGWSLAAVRSTGLTRSAFDRAMRSRRPSPGLIFHSDRGSEYAGAHFRDRLRNLHVRQSTTRGGTPGDNAHAESFFHSLKADVIHGVRFIDDRQLRRCLRRYIQYYNHQRLHSSLGYRSPVAYEREAA